MLTLILAEILILGIIFFLGAYFYEEISWQKAKDLSLKIGQSKKTQALHSADSYKTDGVVY